MVARFKLRQWLLSLSIVLTSAAVGSADTEKAKWDAARTTAPESVPELKSLEDSVKAVVDKVTAATVAVLMPPGAGSGVIVSEDGIVLTAAHVIETQAPPEGIPLERFSGLKPGTVTIILPGDIRVEAKVLGRNTKMDSGMVKITSPIPKNANWPGAKEGKWPYVEIGDSATVKKGQWVVSLGHPGGPKKDRRTPVRLGQIQEYSKRERVLTSDCTLVGGDSGGPLFDLNGKLIGIHSRIGMFIEENVHVPTAEFKAEWKRLLQGDLIGKQTQAYMGIVLNRAGKSEPVVDEVAEGSPAEKAGLKPGDILLKLNDDELKTSEDLDLVMSRRFPNEKITIEVKRGEETLKLPLTLTRRGSSRR